MPYQRATAIEIDSKMREDFRKRLKEYGVSAEATDPVLAVLFRTFAQQLENLYSDTGRIRLALLDELIAGLGIEPRKARPAQAVVRILGAASPVHIDAGAVLRSQTPAGERFHFSTDAPVTVSGAQIVLAAAYEKGCLQLLPGVEMPEQFVAARPALDPVKVNLGPNPALFLAVQPESREHLSGHSFYFDLTPDARPVLEALQSETWCLAGPQGEFSGRGILRPRPANAGLRKLEWLVRPAGAANGAEEVQDRTPMLPPGFYAGRVFLLPAVPPERQFLCAVPRGLEAPLGRIFGREAQTLFAQPRAWFRIAFPRDIPPLHTAIGGVFLHAITASNVECFNQTVVFEKHGTAIPISREGGTDWQLVSPLSLIGENDAPYLEETVPSTNPLAGRYAIRNGRIEITPARWPDGRPQSLVNIRVWISAGEAANRVGPGMITSLELRTGGALRVLNPTSAAGGTSSESYASAQERFAAALLARDRVVTRADLFAVVRAFDRRIRDARVSSAVERVGGALRRVERVTVSLAREDFADPDLEASYLRDELEALLEKRFLHDIGLSVRTEWVEP